VATALVFTLGLGACSRDQHVTQSLTGMDRGAGAFDGGTNLPSVAKLALNPTTVAGGSTSTGTITLSSASPAGGTVVSLRSSNTARATVAASATVAGGATTATFTVTALAATANATVNITASANGSSRSASLSITPGGGVVVPPVSTNPCVSLAGFGGTIVPVAASVPQNRAARLRIEIQGDVAAGTLTKLGSCATPVSFISGRATASGGGVSVSEVFGTLAAVPGEPGVVLATAANGDVLEIIWPALAVPPVAGAPIIRFQLARSGQAGATLSVTASITARTANGATATFNAAASGLVIPALR
jgi:hypothetical protein